MKCKICGEGTIDIIENVDMKIITPMGFERRVIGSTFSARCPNCMSESSLYLTEEDAKTKGVSEVFE